MTVRSLFVLVFGSILAGCATSQNAFLEKTYEQRLCVDGKPTKKVTITISAYTGFTHGTALHDVPRRASAIEYNLDTVASEFLPAVARVIVRPRSDSFWGFEYFHNDDLQSRAIRFKDADEFHLVPTKADGSSYVLCHTSTCARLQDPVTGAAISEARVIESTHWFYKDAHYFSVKGLPESQRLSAFVIGPWNSDYNRDHWTQHSTTASDYVIASGNNIAVFMKRHYWSKTEVKCPECTGESAREIATERRDLNPLDLIRNGTTLSTKVEGPFIVKLIAFDPTEFCRYAKPRSDLYIK